LTADLEAVVRRQFVGVGERIRLLAGDQGRIGLHLVDGSLDGIEERVHLALAPRRRTQRLDLVDLLLDARNDRAGRKVVQLGLTDLLVPELLLAGFADLNVAGLADRVRLGNPLGLGQAGRTGAVVVAAAAAGCDQSDRERASRKQGQV